MLDCNIINEWLNSLTEAEKDAILKYTLDGKNSYYQKINNHLRGIKTDKDMEIYIHNIDSALSKFNLTSDIKVYRAQGDLNRNLFYKGAKITFDDFVATYKYVKQFITFKNYISTSISEKCAIAHLTEYLHISQPDNFFLLIRGNLKSGSSCGYIEALSKFKNEKELLIMRNKKFSILNVYAFDERTITLEGDFSELEGIV